MLALREGRVGEIYITWLLVLGLEGSMEEVNFEGFEVQDGCLGE